MARRKPISRLIGASPIVDGEVRSTGVISTGEASGSIGTFDINNSLRFDGSGDYLSYTPTTTGDTKKFTMSCWAKFSNDNQRSPIFSAFVNASNNFYVERFSNGEILIHQENTTARNNYSNTTLTDTSKWYHVVLSVDTANNTADDRIKLYIDGQPDTFSSRNNPGQNETTEVSVSGVTHYIGRSQETGDHIDGQIAEMHFIDGQALDPTYFGETRDGVWLPKEVTDVTYGTNGFHLDFADSSTAADLGNDVSGNGNDFSVNGITPDNQLIDTPNLRFASFDPDTLTHASGNGNLTESNLKWVGTAGNDTVFASEAKSSGKWYYEAYINSTAAQAILGWSTTAERDVTSPIVSAQAAYFITAGIRKTNTTVVWNSTTGNDGQSVTIADNDVFGFAIDISSGTLDIYQNGTLITSPALTLPSNKGTEFLPIIGDASSTDSTITANFGQDHTFAGAKTALTTPYSDANGNGEFYYEPPSGFLALDEIDKAKINTVQRWNGLIGNSVARRTTGGKVIEHSGIITTSEAYQSKL